MKRYLVTGASGFLGRHVVEVLRANGHEVVGLARHVPPRFASETGATVLRGDVLQIETIRTAAKGCNGVFHCAGKVSRQERDAESMHQLHVVGTRNVLLAARAEGVRRVVIASTSGTVAISEDGARAMRESDPVPMGLINRFPYYRTKLFAEQEALATNDDDLEVVSVNPSLLLGPGDLNNSSTEDVRLFLERAIPAVPQGGLSFVDARDAADGMLRAMDQGRAGTRYLLGACNLAVREFFARLERISGVPAPRIPLPRSASVARAGTQFLGRVVALAGGELPVDPVSVEMAQLFWYVDATRAEQQLGWSPRDPMDTLVDTVRDLRGVAA